MRAPRTKQVILPAVRPNEGLRAQMDRELAKLIDEMHVSVLYWVTAAYRANPPELAQDDVKLTGSPAMIMREVMRRLAIRWNRRFSEASIALAKYFSKAMVDRSDRQLQSILKAAGFSVAFKMTREANDIMQATIGEQVGLIKSIAEKYLSDVEGSVMRSVTEGRDLQTLTKEIGPVIDLKRIGKGRRPGESDKSLWARTRRRAEFIALDQNNKATASINRVRQIALGIEEAEWLHSGAGKHPRPEHVRWGAERKRYKVAEGMWSEVDGRYVWPGTAINCRCVSKSVVPGFE